MNPYVVIDIGGTSIKYGLSDAKGQLLETQDRKSTRLNSVTDQSRMPSSA